MYCKRHPVLFVTNQVDNDTDHIQQQFDGGLQHKNPAESFGLVRYGLHHPIMGYTSYQPHENNARYTSRKGIGFKNGRKEQLRNDNCNGQQDGGEKKKAFLFVCHIHFQINCLFYRCSSLPIHLLTAIGNDEPIKISARKCTSFFKWIFIQKKIHQKTFRTSFFSIFRESKS